MRLRTTILAVVLAACAACLALPPAASAASCSYTGPSGGSWHTPGNWSCNEIPDSGDDATVTSTVVSVASPATAGSLTLNGAFPGTIIFSNDTTLGVSGAMTADTALVQGAGALTVTGAFTKSGTGTFTVGDATGNGPSPDLVLNGTGTVNGGSICVGDNGDANPDLPNLHVNNTFTVADGAAADPFPCTSGPRVHINAPNGHLIKAAAGTMSFGVGIDNDDTLTVQAGTLNLGGPTSPETSNGAHIANAGTTLGLNNNIPIGSSGRVGGAGTVSIGGLNVTLAAGAILDPAVLSLATIGFLELNGTSPVTLPVLNIHGNGFQATLDSERPVTANALSVTSGQIRNNFALTVPAGGSFSKTTSGQFNITNSGAQGSADLVLNIDTGLDAGTICAAHDGASPLDPGTLQVNQDFTIGAGAPQTAFPCSANLIRVNGPSGRLLKSGAGTTTNQGAVSVTGGTVAIGAGQTFEITNGIAQSSGLTDIASGGVLQGPATLTGGVLQGSGQVTGSVTNTSGTVQPGTSPGTLSVGGDYSQGSGGTLRTEVNGTTPGSQFDVLAVTGMATLDGTLAIASGFTPALTDTFRIVTAGTRAGQFSNVTGAQPGNGRTYTPRYDPDGVTLLMSTGPTDSPPPTPTPTPAPGADPEQCSDGVDNDGDSATDAADPGCLRTKGDESDETVGDLVLCGRSVIRLVRADVRGRSVVLSGLVATQFVGTPVTLTQTLGGKRRKLVTVRPKPDGSFTARVAKPGSRRLAKARYQAQVGSSRSVQLKLPQSLESTSIRRSGGQIVIRGKVKRSVLGARKPVVVRRLLCGKDTVAGSARPNRRGTYVVRFEAPAEGDAALYRAESQVLARPGSRRYVKQFARAVALKLTAGSG